MVHNRIEFLLDQQKIFKPNHFINLVFYFSLNPTCFICENNLFPERKLNISNGRANDWKVPGSKTPQDPHEICLWVGAILLRLLVMKTNHCNTVTIRIQCRLTMFQKMDQDRPFAKKDKRANALTQIIVHWPRRETSKNWLTGCNLNDKIKCKRES